MKSYVLRIYRRDDKAQEITGIVEMPERDVRLAFRSFAELEHILTGRTAVAPAAEEQGGGDR